VERGTWSQWQAARPRLHPLVYEINTRCWLAELSGRHGRPITLADVPEEQFDFWQRIQLTHIWLMGVWASGPRARAQALAGTPQRDSYLQALPGWCEADVGGSPYAIAEYRVPSALGGEAGLELFRARLNQRGLKLVLDFVPNHTGLDHGWVAEHPDWFVQSPTRRPETFPRGQGAATRWLAHGKDPNFAAWADTVQIDYRCRAARAAVTEVLHSVARRCDGLRCDMAMLLLQDVFTKTWEGFPHVGDGAVSEFWAEAISSVRVSCADFLFLAEVYWGLEPRLQALGFDYTYDKELYDRVVAQDALGVQRHLLGFGPDFHGASAHFLENHDEARIASLLGLEAHRAAALLMLGLPGLRLLHDGQLEGARIKTPVQLQRRVFEPVQTEVKGMYEKLLSVLPSTAVGQGSAALLAPRAAWAANPTAENFVLVQWCQRPDEFDLVVVNQAPYRSQCRVSLAGAGFAAHDWRLSDLLGPEVHRRSGAELEEQGLYLDLPGHGAQLFRFEPWPAKSFK
jgi:hypothetical protein